MRYALIGLVALSLAVTVGCGHSPSAPSATTTFDPIAATAAQTAVSSAVKLTFAQVAPTGPISGTPSSGLTVPCPIGGTMTLTIMSLTPTNDSSRTDYNDCRFQSVTLWGAPYLLQSTEGSQGPLVGEVPTYVTATTHTTGGVRFEANGIQGRAQFDCTQVIDIQYASHQYSFKTSGTISWEQPIGTPATIGPCPDPSTP